MNTMIDSQIKIIELLVHSDYLESLAQASILIDQHPNEARAWALRAYVLGQSSRWADAIDDLTHAIDIWPNEPDLFFHRGRYYIEQGDLKKAINDFSEGLVACDHHSNSYYRETLHFMRAYARLEVGDKKGAEDDLSLVRDDFTVWIKGLCSKRQILARCSENS